MDFHIIFFNRNSSVDIAPICLKLLGHVLDSLREGSMSKNVDIGSGYFFMFCRNVRNYFFTTIYV